MANNTFSSFKYRAGEILPLKETHLVEFTAALGYSYCYLGIFRSNIMHERLATIVPYLASMIDALVSISSPEYVGKQLEAIEISCMVLSTEIFGRVNNYQTLLAKLSTPGAMDALKVGYLSLDKFIVEDETNSSSIHAITSTQLSLLSLRTSTLASQGNTIDALAEVPALLKLFLRLRGTADKDLASLPPQVQNFKDLSDFKAVTTFWTVLIAFDEVIPTIRAEEFELKIILNAIRAFQWAAGTLPQCLSWPDIIRKLWTWPAYNILQTLSELSRVVGVLDEHPVKDPATFPWSELMEMCQDSTKLLLNYSTISDSDFNRLLMAGPNVNDSHGYLVAGFQGTLIHPPQHLVAALAMKLTYLPKEGTGPVYKEAFEARE